MTVGQPDPLPVGQPDPLPVGLPGAPPQYAPSLRPPRLPGMPATMSVPFPSPRETWEAATRHTLTTAGMRGGMSLRPSFRDTTTVVIPITTVDTPITTAAIPMTLVRPTLWTHTPPVFPALAGPWGIRKNLCPLHRIRWL